MTVAMRICGRVYLKQEEMRQIIIEHRLRAHAAS